MNIVVFAASDLEYNTIKATLTNWKVNNYYQNMLAGEGYLGENLVELFCTKMGPKNAAENSLKALNKAKGKIALVIGLGGALTLECKHFDLVIYENCYFLEETKGDNLQNSQNYLTNKIECEKNLTNFLTYKLKSENIDLLKGDGLTVSKVVCKAQAKQLLATKYNALTVDMESYQILQAAKEKHIPATVLRIISDDAKSDLPDLSAAMDENGEVNNLKMVLQFVKHPILAANFLRNLNSSVSKLKFVLPKILGGNFAELS
jgi:nucleoside phosphorylase